VLVTYVAVYIEVMCAPLDLNVIGTEAKNLKRNCMV